MKSIWILFLLDAVEYFITGRFPEDSICLSTELYLVISIIQEKDLAKESALLIFSKSRSTL